jgi:hypothetical protein
LAKHAEGAGGQCVHCPLSRCVLHAMQLRVVSCLRRTES